MNAKSVVALLLTPLALTTTASAQAPNPEDITPEGYKFCGWRNTETGRWVMEWSDELSGAYLVGFAQGMTCRDARRNITRVRYTQLPPYRPVRPGYKRRTLKSDVEFSDVRCTRIGGKRKFRWQTGA